MVHLRSAELHVECTKLTNFQNFTLSKSFNFRVVNASDHLSLRLVIADGNGNIVFEDAVGRLGALYVGN